MKTYREMPTLLLGYDAITLASQDRLLPPGIRRVLEHIADVVPKVKTKLELDGHLSLDRMCLVASRAGKELFAGKGLEFVVLGGDIVLSRFESLEHYVLLYRNGEHALTLDLTASQLPWFGACDTVVAITRDKEVELRETLAQEWRWSVALSETP